MGKEPAFIDFWASELLGISMILSTALGAMERCDTVVGPGGCGWAHGFLRQTAGLFAKRLVCLTLSDI